MIERMATPTPLLFGPIGLPVLAAAVPKVIPPAAGRSAWELGMFAVGAFALGMVYATGPGNPRSMTRGLVGATPLTSRQSVVFGLSGALAHSALILAFAAAAAHIGARLHTAAPRMVLHTVIGIAIGVVAAWTHFGVRRERQSMTVDRNSSEGVGPHGGKLITAGHGFFELEIAEVKGEPRFRLHSFDARMHPRWIPVTWDATIETRLAETHLHSYTFVRKIDVGTSNAFWESWETVESVREFTAVVSISHVEAMQAVAVDFADGPVGEAAATGSESNCTNCTLANSLTARWSTTASVGRGILAGLTMASPAAVALILLFLLSDNRERGIALAAGFVAGFTVISSSLTDRLAKGARSGRALKGDATWRPSAAWSGVLACLAIYVVCESWTLSSHTFSP